MGDTGLQRRFSLNWRKIRLAAMLTVVLIGGTAAYVFRPLEQAGAPPLESLDASAEKGRYLAAIGNCSACHTVPGGAGYADRRGMHASPDAGRRAGP